MNGFSGNTFRAVKSDTEWYYIKWVFIRIQLSTIPSMPQNDRRL